MNDCPFCESQIDRNEVILENDLCIFLRRENAILIGSGLIIPRTHRETAFDLTQKEWSATQDIIHQVKKLLDETYHPDGYNLGWNCGAIGGQHIFHAHLHIIPRYKDEPFAGKGIRYWLSREENRR